MLAFVLTENPDYKDALSPVDGLAKYFACTLYGDVDGIVVKGSKKVLVALSYSDMFTQGIVHYGTTNGYNVLVVEPDDLVKWAYKVDHNFGTKVQTVVARLKNHFSRTVQGEKDFVHFVKQYAKSH